MRQRLRHVLIDTVAVGIKDVHFRSVEHGVKAVETDDALLLDVRTRLVLVDQAPTVALLQLLLHAKINQRLRCALYDKSTNYGIRVIAAHVSVSRQRRGFTLPFARI